MSKNQSQTVMDIMNQIDGVRLHEKHGGKFRFRMYMTKSMIEAPIETLDLGVRAYNSLRRAGFSNIGELAEAVSSGTELKSIRNCGAKSVREIMEHLFLYQYNSLPMGRQDDYLKGAPVRRLKYR